MDESEGKRLLLAQAYIEADGGLTLYRPGDVLPSDAPDAEAWVEAGTAIWVDADYQPPKYAQAKPATAPAGLPGLAIGGEATGDDLVGRVPVTPERMRRRG